MKSIELSYWYRAKHDGETTLLINFFVTAYRYVEYVRDKIVIFTENGKKKQKKSTIFSRRKVKITFARRKTLASLLPSLKDR